MRSKDWKNGMMEYWNDGVMQYRSDGIMGRGLKTQYSNPPPLQHSALWISLERIRLWDSIELFPGMDTSISTRMFGATGLELNGESGRQSG
jgi:hypothetical protein